MLATQAATIINIYISTGFFGCVCFLHFNAFSPLKKQARPKAAGILGYEWRHGYMLIAVFYYFVLVFGREGGTWSLLLCLSMKGRLVFVTVN